MLFWQNYSDFPNHFFEYKDIAFVHREDMSSNTLFNHFCAYVTVEKKSSVNYFFSFQHICGYDHALVTCRYKAMGAYSSLSLKEETSLQLWIDKVKWRFSLNSALLFVK